MADALRLVGKVDGAVRSFLLAPGTVAVGRSAGNDVVLPDPTVSGRHARLRVERGEARVEDLGSKNGTFVNDRPVVDGGALGAGDTLRVGGVELACEELDPGDLRMGLSFGMAAERDRSLEKSTTLESDTLTPVSEQLVFTERLVDHLRGGGADGAQAALGELMARLGTDTGCLLLDPLAEEPVVLAGYGSVEGLSDARLFARLAGRVEPDAGACPQPAPVEHDAEGRAAVLLPRSGRPDLGVVVCSPLAGGFELEGLLRCFVKLVDASRSEAGSVRKADSAEGGLGLQFPAGFVTGRSRAMAELLRETARVADTGVPLLLVGETGVGKELIARTVHLSSERHRGPFVPVNCAAIPNDLLEAEMYGVRRGAATGVEARPGKFELADGGTLFLDEIADMPLPLQAKLLRAVQEGEVVPLGGRPVPVDVRILSATNADLAVHIEEGRFRRDLYFRLAGYVLEVPPLRQRPEDVPQLIEHFASRFARDMGKSVRGVTLRALEILTGHPWPGNVRQLENVVRRLVLACPDGEAVDSSMLEFLDATGTGSPEGTDLTESASLEIAEHVDELEGRLIVEALRRTRWNRSRAAELLGISRNGLASKMERLGIEP